VLNFPLPLWLIVILAWLLGSVAAAFVWAALFGVSRRLDNDTLPTDDQPSAKPAHFTSDDWLDHIDNHRFVECAFTDVEGCRECGWLAMFGIVCERMMTGRVRWSDGAR
jgi:hypothetical protein